MNAERLLDTFLTLVRIDSPSLKEGDIAAYCKQALEQAGCTVRFDDSSAQTGSNVGNLIASLPPVVSDAPAATTATAAPGNGTPAAPAATAAPGNAAPAAPAASSDNAISPHAGFPKLYFSAHMDTVTPGEGIRPIITDGIIRSSGETVLGGDDKVGVSAIIELVRTLAESGRPHPEIGVLFSVGEEIGLRGAHAMDGGAFCDEPCFVLDANGEPGTVIIGAPFRYLFTATFSGKAAHAGIEPEKGLSAVALASKAVLAARLGRLDEYTTANVGTISGGNALNIVPDSCVVTGEFRAMNERRVAEVRAQLASAFDGAVEGTGGSVAVEWEEEYRGFSVEADDPLVRMVLDEARALGFPAQTVVTGGGSDANVFAGKSLRPLVLGTGMTDVHGLNESLAIRDLEGLTRLCIAIAYACAPC
jgi:tripeptide aminopeptidase